MRPRRVLPLLVLPLLVLLLAAVAPTSAAAQGGVIGDAEFDGLFADLGSDTFIKRERAEKRLQELAAASRLAPAHVGRIHDAIGGGDREVARRADHVFQRFLPTLATYRELLHASEIRELAPLKFDADGDVVADGRFQFDGATGRFGGPGTNSNLAYSTIFPHWVAAQEALARGHIGDAEAALDRLRAAVAGQPPFRIDLLQLRSRATGRRLDQDALLAQIDQARAILPLLRQELRDNGLDPDPAPKPRGALNVPGPQRLDPALVLDVDAVPIPGILDVFSPLAEHARAVLPTSLAYVGPIFDLGAGDGLVVADSVHLTLAFSRVLGDPARYRILRVANGAWDLLPLDDPVDRGARLVTASYLAGSAGTDQFGSFAVVQAVPEPAPIWLLVGGVGALVATRAARRRVGNPSNRCNRRGGICGVLARRP